MHHSRPERVVDVPDSGHAILGEQPRVVAEAIIDVVSRFG